MTDRLAEISAVLEISQQQIVFREAYVLKPGPPIVTVQLELVSVRVSLVLPSEFLKGAFGLRRKAPLVRALDDTVSHQRSGEAVVLQLYIELAAEGLDPLVAGADPFAAEFADQIGILREVVREHAAPDAVPGFKHRHLPTGPFQSVGGGKSGETSANDNARVRLKGEGSVEEKGNAERGDAGAFQKIAPRQWGYSGFLFAREFAFIRHSRLSQDMMQCVSKKVCSIKESDLSPPSPIVSRRQQKLKHTIALLTHRDSRFAQSKTIDGRSHIRTGSGSDRVAGTIVSLGKRVLIRSSTRSLPLPVLIRRVDRRVFGKDFPLNAAR